MEVRGVDHLAIAVDDFDALVKVYTQMLEREPDGIEVVADQGVKVAMFSTGNVHIELIAPLDDNPANAVRKFIQKKGNALHHIGLKVDSADQELSELTTKGFKPLSQKPRKGFGGKQIFFIHPSQTGVLFEFVGPTGNPTGAGKAPRAEAGDGSHQR